MADAQVFTVLARALKQAGVKQVFSTSNLVSECVEAFCQEGIILVKCSNSSKAVLAAHSYSRCQGLGSILLDEGDDVLQCVTPSNEHEVALLICLLVEQDETQSGQFSYLQVCLRNINDVDQGIKDAVLAAMEHRFPVYVRVHTRALNETSDATSDVLTKSRTLALKKKEIVYQGVSEGNVETSLPEEILSESLPLLFCHDLEEMKEDLSNDGPAFCCLCQQHMVSKDFVVSYEMCNGHVFHLKCFEHLPVEYLSGNIQCPFDRSPLSGPRKTWIFRSDYVPDDDSLKDDDSDLCILKFDRSQECASIENQCSICSRRYQVQDEKITLLLCSHTFCRMCFNDAQRCPVCGGESEPLNRSSGEFEIHHGLSTMTMSTDIEDTNGASVSQAYVGRLDLHMIFALEDLVGIRQGEEYPSHHQNEVNEGADEGATDEEPAGNEELENGFTQNHSLHIHTSLGVLNWFYSFCAIILRYHNSQYRCYSCTAYKDILKPRVFLVFPILV